MSKSAAMIHRSLNTNIDPFKTFPKCVDKNYLILYIKHNISLLKHICADTETEFFFKSDTQIITIVVSLC